MVFVNSPLNKTLVLNLNPSTTTLRSPSLHIQRNYIIPISQQRLYLAARLISVPENDNLKLSDLGISQNTTLNLHVPFLGGMQAPVAPKGRLDFLSTKPPPNYVAGLGRGATGFTWCSLFHSRFCNTFKIFQDVHLVKHVFPVAGGEISAYPRRFPSISWRTSALGKLSRPYESSFPFMLKASSNDDFSTLESAISDAKHAEVAYLEPDTRSQLIFVPDSLKLELEDAIESSIVKEKKIKKPDVVASLNTKVDITEIIKSPVRTEAAQREMMTRNTLVFIVDKRADKNDIKEAMKKLLGVSIKRVNTLMTPDGKKKAFIALSPQYNAVDVAKKIKIF